jgi:hypothetical protein
LSSAFRSPAFGLWFGVFALTSPAQLSSSVSVQGTVVHVLLESAPLGGGCASAESWIWGSEQECPKRSVRRLEVKAHERAFIPLSAFADLANVTSLKTEQFGSGFRVRIKGGDAATAYEAVLEFDGPRTANDQPTLRKRTVRSGEFPDEVWEVTTYAFRSGE